MFAVIKKTGFRRLSVPVFIVTFLCGFAFASEPEPGRNLLRGMDYTLHPELSPGYLDNEKTPILTDGRIVKQWQGSVAWPVGVGRVEITFELPEPVQPGLFRLHAIGGGSGSVFFPEKIWVYGESEDGARQLIGISSASPEESEIKVDSAWLPIDLIPGEKHSRLVVQIEPGRGVSHIMLNEAELYSHLKPTVTDEQDKTAGQRDRRFDSYKGPVFSTRSGDYSSENIYSFYPDELAPASSYFKGMCYSGQLPEWPAELHMQKQRELGFNIVHGEGRTAYGSMRWQAVNPSPGVYLWETLDRFVQNAADAGLYAVIALDVGSSPPPRWLLEKFPDAEFINPYGETVPGAADYGHPGVIGAAETVLRKTAERYKDASNIAFYMISDEYSIYQNYYRRKNLMGQNFNERMKQDFSRYVLDRYADIGKFNSLSKKEYACFTEVTPSLEWITEDSYGREWYEWCRFREYESERFYRTMYKAVKSVVPEIDVVLSSVYLGWTGSHVTAGVNIGPGDFFDSYAEKLFIRDNPDGPVAVASWMQNPRGPLGSRKSSASNLAWLLPTGEDGINSEDVYIRGAFEAAGANLNNILYWSWGSARGERRTFESVYNYANYIYADADGLYTLASEAETLGRIMGFFGNYGNMISSASPAPPLVGGMHPVTGFYHEARKNIAAAIRAGNRYPRGAFSDSTNKLMHIRGVLTRANFGISLHPAPIGDDVMKRYEAFSLVGNNYMTDAEISLTRDYLAGGGKLILDMDTGRFSEDGGERDKALFEKLREYWGSIYIYRTASGADNSGLVDFLRASGIEQHVRIENPEAEAGAYLQVFEEGSVHGAVIVIVNRSPFGNSREDVEISIGKGFLPDGVFNAYSINPYPEPVRTKLSSGLMKEGRLHIDIGELKHATVLFLINKEIEDVLKSMEGRKRINPRYKRIPWWDSMWEKRLPITIFNREAGLQSFSLNLGIESAKVGASLPELNSLRLVRYGDNGHEVVPVVFYKDVFFCLKENIKLQAVFRDDAAGSGGLPGDTYYLYMSSSDVSLKEGYAELKEASWFSSVEENAVLIQPGGLSGETADIYVSDSGISLRGIETGEGVYRAFAGMSSTSPGTYPVSLNGKTVLREIQDFPRMVFLDVLYSDGRANVEIDAGEAFNMMNIHYIILAPEATGIGDVYSAVRDFIKASDTYVVGPLMERL